VQYPSKRGAENVLAKMVPVWSLDSKSGVCQIGIVEHFEKMSKFHNGRFLTKAYFSEFSKWLILWHFPCV
jgi:hypothetical protein